MDTIRYLIEALRNKPLEPGITREPGQVPRQVRGGMKRGLDPARKDASYNRYRKIQNAIDEDPVSRGDFTKDL